jgi:hypothetical protein
MLDLSPATTYDAAQLAALLGVLVQIAKPFVQGTWTRTDVVRALCTFLGAMLVPVFSLGAPGDAVTFAVVRTAIAQGIILGAGLTYAVAAIKSAPIPSLSLLPKAADPAPEPPATASAPAETIPAG